MSDLLRCHMCGFGYFRDLRGIARRSARRGLFGTAAWWLGYRAATPALVRARCVACGTVSEFPSDGLRVERSLGTADTFTAAVPQ